MRDYNNYPDFEANSNISKGEQQNLLSYSWYGDELISNKSPRYTRSEQMKILDTHPFFTGLCPKCGFKFSKNKNFIGYKCPVCASNR